MIEIDSTIDDDWGDQYDWEKLSLTAINIAIKNSNNNNMLKLSNIISISLSLSNNSQVQALNRDYRSKDKPTNILSFPMLNAAELKDISTIKTPEIMLGDLILAYDVCVKEAIDKKISITDHFQHLIIHGILHLLGYDHIEDDDADVMQTIEINALGQLGIANPYEKG